MPVQHELHSHAFFCIFSIFAFKAAWVFAEKEGGNGKCEEGRRDGKGQGLNVK